jgi:hypothetical protein
LSSDASAVLEAGSVVVLCVVRPSGVAAMVVLCVGGMSCDMGTGVFPTGAGVGSGSTASGRGMMQLLQRHCMAKGVGVEAPYSICDAVGVAPLGSS